jgi:hypothetical protein
MIVAFQSCTVENPYTPITTPPPPANELMVTLPANIEVIKGSIVATTNFVSTPTGATFAWTNSNTAIGLVASGTGNVPSFTTTNTGTTPIVATITVTPTLNGTAGTSAFYTIIVNPIAPIIATVTVPANIAITKGNAVATTNFVSTPTGATFTWTNSNTAIGLAASGSGNVPSFTATNAGTTAIVATITVTPTLSGTAGTPSSYIITVNPTTPSPTTPTVTVPANITVNNNGAVAATSFISTPAGGTFAWTNSNTAIGIAASGTGNIPSFTAINTGTTSITATITVTPTVTGVKGTPSSYTITVNPTAPTPTAITLTGSASGLSKSHNAGQNCVACHTPGGQASKFPWKIGGTTYTSAAGTTIVSNLVVKFYTGPNGTGTLKYILNGDKLGNIYSLGPVDFTGGLYPAVVGPTTTKYMGSPVSTPTVSCNSCHTGGTGTARVWAN